MALLDIRHVDITYHVGKKDVYAVQDANLVIEPQDAVGIVGESGSGKSTLAMGILRLLSERISTIKGEVIFDGQDLLKLSNDELRKLRWAEIAVVFQKSMNALSPVHRVGKQMMDVYHIHRPHADKNEAKALEWHHKAAENGDVMSQSLLGTCYSKGIGVVKDEAKAIEWYRKAAKQGDKTAQDALRKKKVMW